MICQQKKSGGSSGGNLNMMVYYGAERPENPIENTIYCKKENSIIVSPQKEGYQKFIYSASDAVDDLFSAPTYIDPVGTPHYVIKDACEKSVYSYYADLNANGKILVNPAKIRGVKKAQGASGAEIYRGGEWCSLCGNSLYDTGVEGIKWMFETNSMTAEKQEKTIHLANNARTAASAYVYTSKKILLDNVNSIKIKWKKNSNGSYPATLYISKEQLSFDEMYLNNIEHPDAAATFNDVLNVQSVKGAYYIGFYYEVPDTWTTARNLDIMQIILDCGNIVFV